MRTLQGFTSIRGALLSLLLCGNALAQALVGTSLSVSAPQLTSNSSASGSLTGSVNGSTARGATYLFLNYESAMAASGGQTSISAQTHTDRLVSNAVDSFAVSVGGDFSTTVNNPVPASSSANGPYYIGGMRASLLGTLNNTTLNGAAAAVIGKDYINNPITYAAHLTGKSYFSDGIFVASGASTSGIAARFNGDVLASAYYTFSDARLKKDIRPLPEALERLMQLQPKTYSYSGPASALSTRHGEEMGLVAQEVEKVFPQLVKQTSLRDASGGVVGEYKAVDYASLIPVLVKGMQEQQDVIQAQQARLLQLEAAVQRLNSPGKR
ncbi:tail fiber domain-containing protein [Myxococcus sp. CA040A]|uniref:tail fiber domain-containing protein n=1 Tax=Myxococcus sp. CA040A TaxID=2741738 RepID=UPI001C2D233C|nr:tail fiber domain-containing protein [Myxococcus sp. CA040A]